VFLAALVPFVFSVCIVAIPFFVKKYVKLCFFASSMYNASSIICLVVFESLYYNKCDYANNCVKILWIMSAIVLTIELIILVAAYNCIKNESNRFIKQ
jgi:ABC-type nickel/cobalt efflux system permease component RcnA